MKQIFNQAIDEVSSTLKDKLGDWRFVDGKVYKYVKLQNATATVAGVSGDPVAYGATSGYDNNLVVLDMSDAESQPVGAGFLNATVVGTLATAYYVWITIKGLVTVPTAVGSGVVGSTVRLTSTDKTLGVTTGVLNAMGVELTATAANNKVAADCPF